MCMCPGQKWTTLCVGIYLYWAVLIHCLEKLTYIKFNPAGVRVEGKSSEIDSIKFKISSKTPRGKKDSTKNITIDTTSDSQVNSNFPNRWSPVSLTFNNYFYLLSSKKLSAYKRLLDGIRDGVGPPFERN